MKKNLLMVLGIVLTMSLIGCSQKIEEPVVTDSIINTEVIAPESTEELEEVITEPTEESTETTVEAEPETKVTEEPVVTEAPTEITPEPTLEEEMITGKFNKFNEVISDDTHSSDYFAADWTYVGNYKESITVTEDGIESSGAYNGIIEAADWKDSCEYTSSLKYGESEWKYYDSDGDAWEDEGGKLTKEMTNFGFDFSRFEVEKSETTKDSIIITGVYTLSTDANTLYDIMAISLLVDDVTGNINNVTGDVTIILDLKTKAMQSVSIKYNLNGEEFVGLDEGTPDHILTSYAHTFTFE